MTFLNDAAYARLVMFIVDGSPTNISPCAMTGAVTVDAVKIALGEQCDVWPEAMRDTCIRDENMYGELSDASQRVPAILP